MNNSNLLGKRIKEVRKSKGFTQDKLAEKVGIDVKHLSRIECGKNSLSLNLLYKISDVLNVELSSLFDTTITKSKSEMIEDIKTILAESSDEKIRVYYKILVNL